MTITPSSRPKPWPRRPPLPPSPPLIHCLLLLSATILSKSAAINLDIHIPLPTGGCVMEEALRANLLLRDDSPARSSSSPADGNSTRPLPEIEQPSERIDLFVQHTPHVTLFLSDFDLEIKNATINTGSDVKNDDAANTFSSPLNQTKLQQFLDTISSLNFTHITRDMNCSLSYATTPPPTTLTRTPSSPPKYYSLSGPYAMLPIQNTLCLQTLSSHVFRALQPFLRRPVLVPSWVASLPEPERSRAIYRCREYGSPNVGEGFVPHVSVGFDPPLEGGEGRMGDWRVEVMEEWNEGHAKIQGECVDKIGGIAVGKTGEGGTVLAHGRLGYWDLGGAARSGNYDLRTYERLSLRSREYGESVE